MFEVLSENGLWSAEPFRWRWNLILTHFSQDPFNAFAHLSIKGEAKLEIDFFID